MWCYGSFWASWSRLWLSFFFFLITRRPPRSTLFPNTPLFRSLGGARQHGRLARNHELLDPQPAQRVADNGRAGPGEVGDQRVPEDPADDGGVLGRTLLRDRKSTRLNSSHSQISYAVFCLKKKK